MRKLNFMAENKTIYLGFRIGKPTLLFIMAGDFLRKCWLKMHILLSFPHLFMTIGKSYLYLSVSGAINHDNMSA